MQKGVLRNFIKFTEKQLCQTLFLNKVAGLWIRPTLCEFCEISENTFFTEQLWTTTSTTPQ